MSHPITKEDFENLFTKLAHDKHIADRRAFFLPPCECTDPETKYGICIECYGLPVETKHLKVAKRV